MKDCRGMILSQRIERDNETYITNKGIVNNVKGYYIDTHLCNGYLIKVYSNKECRHYHVLNEFYDEVLSFKSYSFNDKVKEETKAVGVWKELTTPLLSVNREIKDFLIWYDFKLCEGGF